MIVERTSSGSFNHIQKFFMRMRQRRAFDNLDQYGQRGVDALRNATPKDTGKTADSWSYEVENSNDGASISWSNSNVQKDYFNVALGLQFGHGTRNGGWVEGQDYINPAMKNVFNDAEEMVLEEITKS